MITNINTLLFLLIHCFSITNLFLFNPVRYLNILELNSLNIYITTESLKYFFLQFRLSSFFYNNQSIELLTYQYQYTNVTILVYIYFNCLFLRYFKIFTLLSTNSVLYSIDMLFFNFWWLEREVSEMHGVVFFQKMDTRNLLLEYFSILTPLKKHFPVYGLYELYYNIFYFFTIQTFFSLQN